MSNLKNAVIEFSIRRYKTVAVAVTLFTLAAGAFFPLITIDTDPENMLEKNEPVRVFHDESKKRFELSDTIVLGVVNERDPDGVFNPATLKRVHELTEYAKTLRWEDGKNPGRTSGVIEADMIAPSLVDHITQDGPGVLRFEWLMPGTPRTREEARAIRDKALSNQMLKGMVVSEDGKALCIYLPLTDKLLSYHVYEELKKKTAGLGGDEEYHIAGLPVAESAIGVEMFKQMTVAAPLTMVVIFGLLLLFFRKLRLIVLPMIIATVSVVSALGMMIAFGHPVHILSSMLPIFLMPIAICDSVHILSDFFESYSLEKGRAGTLREVMGRLFAPILYTSLTTAAGFLSFLTTSIPPARVFGLFVAVGVMIAWAATILLVPAYVMMIPERVLANFGRGAGRERSTRLAAFLQWIGRFACAHSKPVLVIMALLIVIAVWGISRININDNYAKRFTAGHPIRKADTALNRHFGGTYTAYLVLEGREGGGKPMPGDVERIETAMSGFASRIDAPGALVERIAADVRARMPGFARVAAGHEDFLDRAMKYLEERTSAASDEEAYVLRELHGFLGAEKEGMKTFKRPEVLRYLAGLQSYLEGEGIVGKTTSVADVVRKVNQELTDGKKESFRVPDKASAVSECYLQYQQGHRPNDLWHMVTPDYMSATVWTQFTRGDSNRTARAVEAVNSYLKDNPPPVELSCRWAGLHYVNLVFQDIMFREMLGSFIGSFVIVFLMMVVLFRSVLWAGACMIPLTVTIAAIYGVTGIIGKDYDMPVAVMSTISLGIAVDFAVHFLERSRRAFREKGSWKAAEPAMFGEPALAISRNVLVVALGFLPLMVAHLIPYKVTAVMLFGILSVSGVVTLLFLPALLTVAERWFFRTSVNAAKEVEPVAEAFQEQ